MNLLRVMCFLASSGHVLTLAVCTYLAATEIRTILTTGLICSMTGFFAAVIALGCRRWLLAGVLALTPALAVVLFLLEAFVLRLGPQDAAFPFCIVFVVNQAISTVIILAQLHIQAVGDAARPLQITIRILMVSMVAFSVFFAVARVLLAKEHSGLMFVALGLAGLTLVGLTIVSCAALTTRREARPSEA